MYSRSLKKSDDQNLRVILESFKEVKESIVSNFRNVVIRVNTYSSLEMAEMAQKIFIRGATSDDSDLREFALYVARGINPRINEDWSAEDRGKLLMLAANNGLELRRRYNGSKYQEINGAISIITKTLFYTLQDSKDWNDVFDSSIDYVKVAEDLKNT